MKICNPSSDTLKFSNVPLYGGLADGEYVSAEPMSDTVDSVVGTDGEVAVSVQLDPRWTFKYRVLETSDNHKVLAQFYNLKKRGAGIVGFGPFLFKQGDTGEVIAGANACVMRPPTVVRDRKATMREWTFLICDAEYEVI